MVAALLSVCVLISSMVIPVEAVSECVEGVISEGFYSFSDLIDISDFGIFPEELGSIVSSVIKDDPYLFFVNGRISFSYTAGGAVISLKPMYTMGREDALAAIEFCKKEVADIAFEARNFKTELEMALYVHDYICRNFEYDGSLECDDLYDFLKYGKGTCQSYAAAFMAIMRECGIESHFVASDAISHIWNYVKLDGEWYHADLTWDDNDDGFSRRHFLLSDRLAEERGHRDWYSSVEVGCNSEKYADFGFDSLLTDIHKSGDGDHDGRIGLSDLLLVRRYLSVGDESDICLLCADVNGDGELNDFDVYDFRKNILAAD